MESLPITDSGNVPVYDCHVILSPQDEQGLFFARVASLPSVTATGNSERDVLQKIVATFKAKLIEYRNAGQPIPWAETPETPGPGEVERWIPVHL
ncbi:MAG: hypothetical protein Tsb009_06060 [Planctomycetaceae bacterium]